MEAAIEIKCAYTRLMPVTELKGLFNEWNANEHPENQIEELAAQFRFQGIRHPAILSKRTGKIIAGHGRVLAAEKVALESYPVDEQDFASEAEEYAFLVADNEIQKWSFLNLKKIHLDLPKIEPFPIERLAIKNFEFEPTPNENDADAVPAPPAVAKTKRGELWILGEHRLLIDDCTVKENVERLMAGEKADMVFTDPPYGMNLNTNHDQLFQSDSSHVMKGNRFERVVGDDKPYDPTPLLAFDCQKFIWGCDYFYSRLPDGGSFIAWDKRNENLDAVPGNTAEFCWALPPVRRTSVRLLWSGHHGMQKDDSKTRVHPTQKPTALAEWFFDRWGKDAKNIWDGYLGSGSTLIACEKTKRRCFGMEIEPLYGDVILDRWEKYSGKRAHREDGKTWSEVKNG